MGLTRPSAPGSMTAPPLAHADPTAPNTPGGNHPPQPTQYPFNLILSSATIPNSLNVYLNTHHPRLTRLVSPRLHRLPRTLQPEYVGWTGGNKNADIERRLRRVWAQDERAGLGGRDGRPLSKVLIFCNRSSKVEELGRYFEEKGIRSVGLSARSADRRRGNNKHLGAFLKDVPRGRKEGEGRLLLPPERETRNDDEAVLRLLQSDDMDEDTPALPTPVRAIAPIEPENELSAVAGASPIITPADPRATPHVMLTTSLLSRGLDFAPDIKHVFIIDEPRNVVDFLHRAGRAGRAGEQGKVVIFGKMEGRGSTRGKEIKRMVRALG